MTTLQFENFGSWLRQNRENQRYSMRQLGQAAQVSGTYISTLENNQDTPEEMSPRPSQEVIRRIAEVLNADLHQGLILAGWASGEKSEEQAKYATASSATQLVREKLAAYNGEGKLASSILEALSSEVDDFANFRVERAIRQAQQRGKQLQAK